MPNVNNSSSFVFKKGDILIIDDQNASTYTHWLIQWGLRLTNNQYPSLVHAAIAISEDEIVEMNASGIQLTNIKEKLSQTKVNVFRCKDQKIAKLAADLAVNIEGTKLVEAYENIKGNQPKISYALSKAVFSAFTSDVEISSTGREKLIKITNNLEFTESLFCSEMITMLYMIADNILNDKQILFDVEKEINPSALYVYLITKAINFFEETNVFIHDDGQIRNNNSNEIISSFHEVNDENHPLPLEIFYQVVSEFITLLESSRMQKEEDSKKSYIGLLSTVYSKSSALYNYYNNPNSSAATIPSLQKNINEFYYNHSIDSKELLSSTLSLLQLRKEYYVQHKEYLEKNTSSSLKESYQKELQILEIAIFLGNEILLNFDNISSHVNGKSSLNNLP